MAGTQGAENVPFEEDSTADSSPGETKAIRGPDSFRNTLNVWSAVALYVLVIVTTVAVDPLAVWHEEGLGTSGGVFFLGALLIAQGGLAFLLIPRVAVRTEGELVVVNPLHVVVVKSGHDVSLKYRLKRYPILVMANGETIKLWGLEQSNRAQVKRSPPVFIRELLQVVDAIQDGSESCLVSSKVRAPSAVEILGLLPWLLYLATSFV